MVNLTETMSNQFYKQSTHFLYLFQGALEYLILIGQSALIH